MKRSSMRSETILRAEGDAGRQASARPEGGCENSERKLEQAHLEARRAGEKGR